MKLFTKLGLATFLIFCFSADLFAQTPDKNKAQVKSDTTVYFYVGFELKNGLVVMNDMDSLSTKKDRLTNTMFEIESLNKTPILRETKTQLKGKKVELAGKGSIRLINFFSTNEEMVAQFENSRAVNKGHILMLSNLEIIKSAGRSTIGNPIIH
ncbi:hypothetical protein ACV07N_10310 [Roseivirga echinicomitans]